MATEFEETREFNLADLPRLVPGSILAGRYRLVVELGRGGPVGACAPYRREGRRSWGTLTVPTPVPEFPDASVDR